MKRHVSATAALVHGKWNVTILAPAVDEASDACVRLTVTGIGCWNLAKYAAKDALVKLGGYDPDQVEVRLMPRDQRMGEAVDLVRETRREAESATLRALEATQAAVRSLADQGISRRDVSALLEVTLDEVDAVVGRAG